MINFIFRIILIICLKLYNFTLNHILYIKTHNKQIMSDQIVLGYWGVRGRAQVLRHLLAYSGLKFTQKAYTSPDQYGKDVSTLGNFPNLPYLKDGDFVFTETLGIARYIARRGQKKDMLGKTPADEAIMDNYYYAFNDLFVPIMMMFFDKKVNDVKTGHYYKIKSQLEKFDKFINGKNFILGYPTIADFFLAEYSHYIEKLYPEQFRNYKNIKTVRDSVENLPQVKKYYERPGAIKTPFLPPQKTVFPFFFPGTQPHIPPPPAQKYSIKKPQPAPTATTTTPSSQSVSQPSKQQPPPSITPTHHQAKFQQSLVTQPQPDWSVDIQPYNPGTPHKVAIISGSISGSSAINYFMGAISGIGHPAYQFSWCDISTLQLHNQDIEDGTDNVNMLRGQVYQAEAVLIGVAGTHHITSSVLTNAYNWLVPVLKQKPVGLVSVDISEQPFRKALDGQGIPYLKAARLAVIDPSTFFNEEGGISGASLNKVVHFFNRFAQFIQTGN